MDSTQSQGHIGKREAVSEHGTVTAIQQRRATVARFVRTAQHVAG
jgi:hypothetical protein